MIKDFLIACTGLALLALTAVYAAGSIKDLRNNISRIYKRTPAYILVVAVCSLGIGVVTVLVTGALTTDFHLNLK